MLTTCSPVCYRFSWISYVSFCIWLSAHIQPHFYTSLIHCILTPEKPKYCGLTPTFPFRFSNKRKDYVCMVCIFHGFHKPTNHLKATSQFPFLDNIEQSVDLFDEIKGYMNRPKIDFLLRCETM